MHLRLLVVDDDEQICRMLRMLFEAQEWVVDCAFGGAEADSLLAQKSFDVVVTDLRMESLDSGIDVARHARACANHPAVVILSAARLQRRQWEDYADGYFQKGSDAAHLVRLIDSLGHRPAA
jgi:DNA-binding response OmpR family regulator